MIRSFALALLLPFAVAAQPQAEAPNALLLVAKPTLVDPNFRETVVLVTQAADASTVGVILNRPLARTHERTGEPVYLGGPVMREVLIALFLCGILGLGARTAAERARAGRLVRARAERRAAVPRRHARHVGRAGSKSARPCSDALKGKVYWPA
jgi:hypothetical protein